MMRWTVHVWVFAALLVLALWANPFTNTLMHARGTGAYWLTQRVGDRLYLVTDFEVPQNCIDYAKSKGFLCVKLTPRTESPPHERP